jgi:RNA polymerase sigma-70 factor (ECF subfamily)
MTQPLVPHRSDGPEPSSSTSTSLLHGIQAGLPPAWERFYQFYAPVVARWCRRAGLQEADMGDVLQEVFSAVYRTVRDFRRDRPGDSFHGWFYAITQRKLADRWRRQGKQPQVIGGSDFQQRLEQVAASEDSSASSLLHAADLRPL